MGLLQPNAVLSVENKRLTGNIFLLALIRDLNNRRTYLPNGILSMGFWLLERFLMLNGLSIQCHFRYYNLSAHTYYQKMILSIRFWRE